VDSVGEDVQEGVSQAAERLNLTVTLFKDGVLRVVIDDAKGKLCFSFFFLRKEVQNHRKRSGG